VGAQDIPGIGIFGAQTTGGSVRMIGNIAVESPFGKLVGFENHSGQTVLDADQEPLGRVTKGFGNNPQSGFEGAIKNNVIGTYMHGPVLPKNPALADHLILAAVRRRFGVEQLTNLSDELEHRAAAVALARPQ
jgi:CobQ-like glutamine amidotransferase family enzyme